MTQKGKKSNAYFERSIKENKRSINIKHVLLKNNGKIKVGLFPISMYFYKYEIIFNNYALKFDIFPIKK